MNTFGRSPEDEYWDGYIEDATPEEKMAELMLNKGEMDHGIPRSERARFIGEAAALLDGHGREDYKD